MPVIDNEPPSDALPPGSYWAKTSVPFEYPEEAGQGVDRDPVEVFQKIADWIVGPDPKIRPSTLPHRMGVRLLAMMWVLHPDKLPWCVGKSLSERQAAKDLGIGQHVFSRAVASVTRDFGLSHPYESHAWNKRKAIGRAKKADEAAANERRAELIAARNRRKKA